MRILWVALLSLILCHTSGPPALADQPEIFTTRGAESASDKRYQYDHAVLDLALKKTEAAYGPYELVQSQPMTFPRAVLVAQKDTLENFFFKLSYESRYADLDLSFIPFPVDLGIVGFRVCFLSEEIKQRVTEARSLEEIRTLTHGQGAGWSDVEILRQQGFTVEEVSSYESLFHMVARNRFDLFCRGANELLEEYEGHRHIEGLAYDTSMALVYPLPRFFYTNANNTRAIERVQRGLEIAHQDGSLLKLWLRHYGPSLDFARVDQRRLYRLNNPHVADLPNDYEQYFFLKMPPLLLDDTAAEAN